MHSAWAGGTELMSWNMLICSLNISHWFCDVQNLFAFNDNLKYLQIFAIGWHEVESVSFKTKS
jgi:hypothetical protein